MKKFNVFQFYNGFYCYFKSTYSNFDKVIKLFTLSYLHPPIKTYNYLHKNLNQFFYI